MTKTGEARHVPLSAAVLEMLGKLPKFECCPYLLPNPKTLKPYRQIYTAWDTARTKANLKDVRTHDLRHTGASLRAGQNHSLLVIGRYLGHSQVRSTARYSHLSSEVMQSAADNLATASGLGGG